MWKDKVTIFCKKESNAGDMWFPYKLAGVDVNTDHAWMVKNYGEDTSANCNLHIPCADNQGTITIANYTYKTPKAWSALGADVIEDYITFQGGNEACVILYGDFDFVGPIYDDDYNRGFLQYLKNNYDGVYSVISAKQYSVIPHFEVVGR